MALYSTYLEYVCIPAAAWHTMYGECKSRFCISRRLPLWRRRRYEQQYGFTAAEQLVVNLQYQHHCYLSTILTMPGLICGNFKQIILVNKNCSSNWKLLFLRLCPKCIHALSLVKIRVMFRMHAWTDTQMFRAHLGINASIHRHYMGQRHRN